MTLFSEMYRGHMPNFILWYLNNKLSLIQLSFFFVFFKLDRLLFLPFKRVDFHSQLLNSFTFNFIFISWTCISSRSWLSDFHPKVLKVLDYFANKFLILMRWNMDILQPILENVPRAYAKIFCSWSWPINPWPEKRWMFLKVLLLFVFFCLHFILVVRLIQGFFVVTKGEVLGFLISGIIVAAN